MVQPLQNQPNPQYDGQGMVFTTPHDVVKSPSHYTYGGIETIDYMQAKSTPEEFRGHLRLTAIKYLSRTGHKDDALQDLKKARWYLDKLIEVMNESAS